MFCKQITGRDRRTNELFFLALSLLLAIVLGCQSVSEPQDSGRPNSLSAAAQNAQSIFITPGEAGPVLTVTNEYTEPVVSTSLNEPSTIMDIPAEQPLIFCWTADASATGGVIEAYRYGWDIADLNDPDQWETDFTPFDGSKVCSTSRAFSFGTHWLHVEVIDNLGARSRVGIIVNIVLGPPAFDILPGSCKNPLSPRRMGVIPAAIPGTFGLDVRDIDVSTLRLWIDGDTTVEPLRTRIGDVAAPVINGDLCDCSPHGADGIDDLLLNFSAAEINDALGQVTKGEVREIAIQGFLLNGLDFAIFDCVTIVGKSTAEGQPPLRYRDDVLATLEEAYNQRDFDRVNILLDGDFTFYFSEADIRQGDVTVTQWDRDSELVATANLFGVGGSAVTRHSGTTKRIAPNIGVSEEATWGLIKHFFFNEPTAGATSISLSLVYPPGEDTWVPIVPPAPAPPGQEWFEKTASYALIVQTGDITWITGSSTRASFVVRSLEADGESIWQLVGWRDDI